MKTTPGLNRRQWLRTAGLTLAGIFVAPRLVQSAATGAPSGTVQPESAAGTATPEPKEKGPRHYLHGFEVYPTA